MTPYLPFPFPDGEFPENLTAVVQSGVLDGSVPARRVVHAPDNSWSVADGVTDPREPGAGTVAGIHEAVDWNASVAGLASLPVGHVATRAAPGEPWTVAPYHRPPEVDSGQSPLEELGPGWAYGLTGLILFSGLIVIVFAFLR